MTPEERYRSAMALNAAGQPKRAVEELERAADERYAPACFAMASVFAMGQFVPVNLEAARHRLRQGHELGHAASGRALATFAAHGVNAAPDWPMALSLLASLSNAGDRVATRELALLALLQGDHATASDLLLRACEGEAGDAIAAALMLPSIAVAKHDATDALSHRLAARRVPMHLLNAAPIAVVERGEADLPRSWRCPAPPVLTELAGSPRVGVADAVLSPTICDYLILSAFPVLQPAQILDPVLGMRTDPYRTGSTATFSLMQESPVLCAIREMMCAAAGAASERGEFLSVISYTQGQEYRPHFDAFAATCEIAGAHVAQISRGGQRTHTVLANLNNAFTGGETVFPALGVSIAPRLGQFIVFSNVDAAGERHPNALHFGAPVQSGAKLLASQWVRHNSFPLAST